MLLGSPPDMVHADPAHGAHIRMQNSAKCPVRYQIIIQQFAADCKTTAA